MNLLASGNGAFSVISMSGSYYLSANIMATAAYLSGIYINADNVTVDLNGFTISSATAGGGGSGITVAPGKTNIRIRNGHIVGTTTYSAPNFTKGGFNEGINADATTSNIIIEHVTVSQLAGSGILANGQGVIIHDCTISTIAKDGISAALSSVRQCQATICGVNGIIFGHDATDCHGETSGSGKGLWGMEGTSTTTNCTGVSGSGTGCESYSANNCRGITKSGSYALVAGQSANFCDGQNYGNALSIITGTAIGCTGNRGILSANKYFTP